MAEDMSIVNSFVTLIADTNVRSRFFNIELVLKYCRE